MTRAELHERIVKKVHQFTIVKKIPLQALGGEPAMVLTLEEQAQCLRELADLLNSYYAQ